MNTTSTSMSTNTFGTALPSQGASNGLNARSQAARTRNRAPCVLCQKRKQKCEMDCGPPCKRCEKEGKARTCQLAPPSKGDASNGQRLNFVFEYGSANGLQNTAAWVNNTNPATTGQQSRLQYPGQGHSFAGVNQTFAPAPGQQQPPGNATGFPQGVPSAYQLMAQNHTYAPQHYPEAGFMDPNIICESHGSEWYTGSTWGQ